MSSISATSTQRGHGRLARSGVALLAITAATAALASTLPGAALLVAGGAGWVALFAAAWVLPPPPTERVMRFLVSCLFLAVLVAVAGVVGIVGDWIR
jgi:hypothetical protein